MFPYHVFEPLIGGRIITVYFNGEQQRGYITEYNSNREDHYIIFRPYRADPDDTPRNIVIPVSAINGIQ